MPIAVIGDKVIVGDGPIIDTFTTEADKFLEEGGVAVSVGEKTKESGDKSFDLTWAMIAAASLVDAINPCAFAVLIILMTTILASGDGKKAFKAGLAFSASVFISYFLMGLGFYKALGMGGVGGIFYQIVGWLAIIIGIFNIKDYFWYGRGFVMEVPMSWRPKLKSIIRSATSVWGAFLVGFLVSIFLLPCTSGPYIVILGMLASRPFQMTAISYLLVYNLIFVSPMILISWAVYKGFNVTRAEEIRQKQLRTLHLIAGIIMILMGAILLMGWI